MKRAIITLAAMAGMASGALAAGAEGKDCITKPDQSSNCDDCLLKDNRPNGAEYCVKDGAGMSQAAIDA